MKHKTWSRRAFLNTLWTGLGVLTIAELAALLGGFFKPRAPRNHPGKQAAITVAGKVDQFEPGSVNAFVQGKFYLVRLEDGGFLAVSRRCTHLSCTVPWVSAEQRFVCPCHSSAFDMQGDVVSPPAPRALDLHPVAIENNVISVDTGTQIKRAAFNAAQATYPEST